MDSRSYPLTLALCLVCWASCHIAKASEIDIVRDGQPAVSIVVVVEKADWLSTQAAETLRSVIRSWTGVEVPVSDWTPGSSLPNGPLLVLTEAESISRLPSNVEREALGKAGFLSDGGFACQPGSIGGQPAYFIVGKGRRGLFNGAEYVREFLLDGRRDALRLQADPISRAPQSGGRPVYLLTIWGNEAEYGAADWEKIFDSFARDGFDRVYFWLSGHFPSRKYPQTYRVKDDQWDTTEKSRIGTLDDQRRILRAAHQRGLKFYLGGALGGWVGTRYLTNQEPETMKIPPPEGPYEGKYSLCPSHPKSRKALVEYYKEMFDAFPEADGIFIESADEWGACTCSRCSKPVDQSGSTYFGQAQLSLLQQLASTVWRDHPHARFCYTIGYDEHKKDPAYYSVVAQMRDPRFEWMEPRNSWVFPTYYGKALPAPYFSRQVMRWQQYYAKPLQQIVDDAARASVEGWYGLINAFEPGAGSGSFYKDIPFPTDKIPYVVTQFVLREATWDAPMNADQMLSRVYARFFGKEAPRQAAQALWDLREIIRDASAAKLESTERERLLQQVSNIEKQMESIRPTASPKTLETLELMQTAVKDVREHLAAGS